MGEAWTRIYQEAPELFEAFARAEDPEGRVLRRLLGHADLAGSRVLELGCGTGRLARHLAPIAALYLATEPLAPMLSRLRDCPEARPCRARGEALPLRDATIDRILASYVLVNLGEQTRAGILREARRVLGPSGEVWLLESAAGSEFQALRGPRAHLEAERIEGLVAREEFQWIDAVETELRFPSAAEAERVLGALCGEGVREALRRRPRTRLGHRVAILRWRPTPVTYVGA